MTSDWLDGAGPPSFSPAGGGGGQEGLRLRVGEVYGARSFLVSRDGWLHGVWMKKRWTPGINEAQCWRPTGYLIPGVGISTKVTERYTPALGQHWNYTVSDETGDYEGYVTEKPKYVFGNQDNPDHTFADCKCGLYGFMSGSMDYSHDRRSISGVVRAFGKMSLGTRGFRAQYAEIVAIYMPEAEAMKVDVNPGMRDGLRRAHIGREVSPEILQRVSANYPDVPMYLDLDQMLALHPTEEPS